MNKNKKKGENVMKPKQSEEEMCHVKNLVSGH